MIVDDLFESPQTCPECGGPAFSDLLLAEKKDACYHKVRSRYKVWPSAYASGALVQCRKKGAANWGNKSEGVAEGFPQPGESSGKAKQFNPNAKIQTREMTLDQILGTVKGIPYVNEVIQDWDAKDYNWGVTKKVIEYAKYLQKNPQSVANLPPLVVIDGQLNDGAHRLSAINLLQKRMDPKNPLWKQVKLKVNFGTSTDVASEQGVAEDQLDEKCWDTHRQAGMKKKGDRMVPNCVPKEGVEEDNFAGDTRVELGGATAKKLQSGDTVSYFGEPARVIELNPAKNYARISANGKTMNVRLSDLKRTGQGVEEAQYDRGDYYNAHKAGEYGRDLPYDDDRRGHGSSRSTERDGRDDHLAGQSANLPADPFGRTTGAVPKAGTGKIHNIALPGEIDEADKIGNMDADRFDDAMSRLKQLAGQGPRKTVWDPVKRVYKTVPVNPQPK